MATDPGDPRHLYLGTANGWIYESRDGGGAWRRLARVGKRDDLVLDNIIVDPHDAKHLIVGAWVVGKNDDGGLYISYDAGVNWVSQAELRGQSIRALAMSALDSKTLVAGSLQGVFRSRDSGQRWKRISPADSTELHEVESVAIDPKDPNVIYAGTWHLPWKTTDGGEHWDNIKDGIIDDSDVFSIIVDPVTNTTVYASACSGIYKSENAGGVFRKIQGIPSTARRTRILVQDPKHLDTVFAGTTEGLFRTEDAGRTWTRTTGPEVIVNDVLIDDSDSRHVLLATDRGGVLASEDGGDTFHSSNAGFSTRQITALKRDSNHPATIYVGVVNDKEWGGVFQSDNGGLNWVQRSDGLQGRDVFSLGQAADGTLIAGTGHGLYRLDAEAETWKRVEDAPGAAPSAQEPAHAAPPATRPPVPVNRNHFAEHKGRPVASAQRRPTAARNQGTAVQRKDAASHKSSASVSRSRLVRAKTRPSPAGHAPTAAHKAGAVHQPIRAVAAAPVNSAPAPAAHGFDGSVYSIASADGALLAATSLGLLTSANDGITWSKAGPEDSAEWRYLAAVKQNAVAASLHAVAYSSDSGKVWVPVKLPEALTQVAAVAVDRGGEVWVGGREGVFVSSDAGNTWTTPKNLFVNSVNSVYYDDAENRIMVTTAGYSSIVFTVQLPQKQVTFADTGWNLRFVRPVGDHLIAVTLFDGVVVQPKMIASPVAPTSASTR